MSSADAKQGTVATVSKDDLDLRIEQVKAKLPNEPNMMQYQYDLGSLEELKRIRKKLFGDVV